ncbi:SMP-30/gluconolactonase/LRE family protein [Streptantibioticus ferralitis]|uniref:Sugar lactone lactonase YvrE n=1 Tax=Streptantibioticus ferralitis TaxID=236510 RepID=A0ABT5YVA6_9ACTN|nr:hypothetical protein [Streptantibioticus ferralitis]MDF2255537.1 hypothetical protein [Streptantibioticus ferralitis]
MQWGEKIPLVATVAATSFAVFATQASAVTPPLSDPQIVRHLDLAAGQQPENLTTEADGFIDMTMSFAHQIDRLTPDGELHVLATLPAPPDGTHAPLTGRAFIGGIVRVPDGTLYVLYSTGTDDLTGLWKLPPGGTASRVAAMPGSSVPNGLALHDGSLYATDSSLGAIWRIPLGGGAAAIWKAAPELAAATPGGFGANGLKIRDNAVWVTNMDRGTLLRVPIGCHGAPGAVHTVATGLGTVDDFAFTGDGDNVLAANNQGSEVELVRTDGSHTVVLTAADGLQNPTSITRRGDTVYIANAAYFTATDPNLLSARILRQR